jgi:hypothetical protein
MTSSDCAFVRQQRRQGLGLELFLADNIRAHFRLEKFRCRWIHTPLYRRREYAELRCTAHEAVLRMHVRAFRELLIRPSRRNIIRIRGFLEKFKSMSIASVQYEAGPLEHVGVIKM